MPLYQLVCIAAHYAEYKHIKDLVTVTAKHVMDKGGVVRKLDSWGTMSLPQRIRKNKVSHNIGDYWSMNFDASPETVRTLGNLLRRDARVVRWTTLKQGERIQDIVQPRSVTTPLRP